MYPYAVTHIVDSVADEGAGLSYSVPALCAALGRSGMTVRLRSIEAEGDRRVHPANQMQYIHEAQSNAISNILRTSPDLRKALFSDARDGSILHAHGLWLMPNVYPALAARRYRGAARLIHAPRGMLGRAALDISYWKKKSFWWCLQRSALKAADCLHATADSEYEEIRSVGLKNPVAVIPNGIDLPDIVGVPRERQSNRVVVSLGRLHPKKGLDRLIRAWIKVESDFPEWRLRIIGPSEVNHGEALKELAFSLGAQRITVEGPIFGDTKLAVYRSADLFVLPTLNENFALTVAEALAAEVPVISSKGAPWSGLETQHCGWWIDHGVEALARSLRVAMILPPEKLHEMGVRGRSWMSKDFGWNKIALDMLEVYRWLRLGGEPPETVRLR